ncbi:MAG: hypothetical protein GY716_03645 [bacterium]|nr:hypothetical protein [bacterium]
MALALGACVSFASADVTLVTQGRSVAGAAFAEDSGGSDSDADSSEAPDFGPFVDARDGTANVYNAYASGGGNQNSTITGNHVFAQGAAFANAEGYDSDGFGDASGSSLFDFTFQVGDATPYTIDVSLAAYDSGGTSFLFTGPSGDVLTVESPFNDEVSSFQSGLLQPGQYRLKGFSAGSCFGDFFFYDYAFGEFRIELTLGAPGDANGDGIVNFADILAVIGAWGPCPAPPTTCAGDVNHDGTVNFADILEVLGNWS